MSIYNDITVNKCKKKKCNKCKKKKCNLYFKSVYQLQETRATKALGRLDRRLTVPSEALDSSKEINFLFLRPHRESNPGCLR